jgi:lipid-binding SYLF domain-containing protein
MSGGNEGGEMVPGMFETIARAVTRAPLVRLDRLLGVALVALLPLAASADEAAEAQQLVDKARQTIEDFKADPDMTWFRDHVGDAEALMIIPVLLKAGLIFGGSGGHGALLDRDRASGEWSHPAFYFMGSVTFGLQIGGEAAEVVLMIMTERGKAALLSTELKLGADVSVAAGPIGAGAQAATVDVLAFSRTKGLFGGLTVEGAVIEPRDSWNHAYYGRPVSPVDILVTRSVRKAAADPLRRAVAATGGGAESATEQAPTPAATPAPAPEAVYDIATIQRALLMRGYDAGPADGVIGPRTRRAIRQYQEAQGLAATGEPSAELQRMLSEQ